MKNKRTESSVTYGTIQMVHDIYESARKEMGGESNKFEEKTAENVPNSIKIHRLKFNEPQEE